MVESLIETSDDVALVLRCDRCDPRLNEYPQDRIVVGERESLTEIINRVFQTHPGYKFYSVSNDDFVYRTPHWDSLLIDCIDDVGIAYGNDNLAGKLIPTTSIISGDIVRALGWLQLPGLIGLYGDNVWAEIGRKLGRLHYIKSVRVEHIHPLKYKEAKDETFLRTNSKERYRHDEKVFIDWLKNRSNLDIMRVKSRCGIGNVQNATRLRTGGE